MTRPRLPSVPVALTIAGSDSGGGAGIQADLKTFAAFGVHGTSVLTCLTAQSPRGVRGVQPVSPRLVRLQFEAVWEELAPQAVKTGMLYSAAIVRAVCGALEEARCRNLVVDPVMIATSGARLLRDDAQRVLCSRLLPLARVVTPNLDEAQVLLGHSIRSVDALGAAALELSARYGCAFLLKGGHLRGATHATDALASEGRLRWYRAPFVRGVSTHGTGCTYAAAMTAGLAAGASLEQAVAGAKRFVTRAIRHSVRIGPHTALWHR